MQLVQILLFGFVQVALCSGGTVLPPGTSVHVCILVLFLSKSEGRGSVPADAVASPRRWTISRCPLVLSAGGNTILFRLLTKPLFCSFPPLDARKASNGGFCSGREEVSEQHKELNKIKILFNLGEGQNGISHMTVFRVLSWPLG